MVRLSGSRKMNPGFAYFGRKSASISTAARHVFAPIRVVKGESDLGAVKCARPPIQYGCLPGKPVQISRSLTQRSFRLALLDRIFTHRRRRNMRPQIERLG